ncbi:hypothetical protein T492DRAFT_872392 [Pavlovales sp. CCMP2436]|nr:hypothetical protein T492DRAFT_872392 [Pavlovales sp. CCMP2436]
MAGTQHYAGSDVAGAKRPQTARVRAQERQSASREAPSDPLMYMDDSAAARWWRLAAEQGNAKAQTSIAVFYFMGKGGVPQDLSGGARLFRRAAEQGEPGAQTGDEKHRLEALALLSAHAHEPDVVKACCVGCGQTRKLSTCSKCLTAKFCGAESVRRMWPVHKQSCKTLAAAWQAAAAAADGSADEHGAEPAAE